MSEKVIQAPNMSITAKYPNKWVVLSQDYKKVIASGGTLSAVLKKTDKEKNRVVIKVLPNLGYTPFSIQ